MKYFAFLENGELLDKDPSYKFIVVLENIKGHISDSDSWRGIIGRNIVSVKHACGGASLLNVCAGHGLSIMNTMQGGQSSGIGRYKRKKKID